LNPSQLYSQFVNAFTRDVEGDIVKMLQSGSRQEAWDHYLGFVKALTPEALEFIIDTPDERNQILDGIQLSGLYHIYDSAADSFSEDMWFRCMEFRPPNKSRVKYVDQNGNLRHPIEPALIGEVEIWVLDKISHKPMAVSGVTRQHYGLAAAPGKSTKYQVPGNQKPARVFGETETRQGCCVMGGAAMAEILRMSTDPETHREVCSNVYTAEHPGAVEDVIDRDKQHGLGRPVEFVRHIMSGIGLQIVDIEEQS